MARAHEPRNPNLKSKPNALAWFAKNPAAKKHFDLAKNLLTSHYTDRNHGFIDRRHAPEYRFNSGGQGFTQITASRIHSTVRFVLSESVVPRKYRKMHCRTMKNATGKPYNEVYFLISDKQTASELAAFLDDPKTQIENFGERNQKTELTDDHDLQERFDDEVKELLKQKHLPQPRGVVTPSKRVVTTTNIARDPKVKAWLLQNNVDFKCECCQEVAPFFLSDRTPFFEVHHLKRLADDGSDRVSNAVVICPNCHRELHHGPKSSSLLEDLYGRIGRLARE